LAGHDHGGFAEHESMPFPAQPQQQLLSPTVAAAKVPLSSAEEHESGVPVR
jgi:hypothetical protein